jgi:hypothetical protein
MTQTSELVRRHLVVGDKKFSRVKLVSFLACAVSYQQKPLQGDDTARRVMYDE